MPIAPPFLARRLQEQYTLKAQLFCHQESLLPGQSVPLLLQLALQLHGRPAPLALLQEVNLRLTATTHEGAEVTQVGCSALQCSWLLCPALITHLETAAWQVLDVWLCLRVAG